MRRRSGLVVLAMVVGEEIGWRGGLLARAGPWRASVVPSSLWALWHLPLFFLASMPQFGHPVRPYFGYTIALSLILTYLGQRTRGSVVIATLHSCGLHGDFGIRITRGC